MKPAEQLVVVRPVVVDCRETALALLQLGHGPYIGARSERRAPTAGEERFQRGSWERAPQPFQAASHAIQHPGLSKCKQATTRNRRIARAMAAFRSGEGDRALGYYEVRWICGRREGRCWIRGESQDDVIAEFQNNRSQYGAPTEHALAVWAQPRRRATDWVEAA